MEYDNKKYKNIYDDIYSNIESYNFKNSAKEICVDIYASTVEGKILDAGCGQGGNLRRLFDYGYDVFGIEISSVCCDKYLIDLPHKNIDIIEYSKEGNIYDGIICMDVLEHIPYDNLGELLKALSNMTKTAFFGIANHSDIIRGQELHLIQEDKQWWKNELSKYFKNVEFVFDQFDGIFYYFYCSNITVQDITYKLLKNMKRIVMLDNLYLDVLSQNDKLMELLNVNNTTFENKLRIKQEYCTNLENENVELKKELNLIKNTKWWRLHEKIKG